MGTEQIRSRVPAAEVRCHEAAIALASVVGPGVTIKGIERLKANSKTRVYRMEVSGAPFDTVVAKRKSSEDELEKAFYEHFLPSAGLPTLRIYSELKRPEERCFWRFVEDAGEQTVSDSHDERCLTAQWLTRLHVCEGLDRFERLLHERGSDYYLRQLRSVHKMITTHCSNEFVDEMTRRTLQHIAGQLDELDRRWNRIGDWCADTPQTLVHGDLVKTNARIRHTPKGIELLVLDWETAGMGPPSIDLTQGSRFLSPDLPSYVSGMKAVWPAVTLDRVNGLATIGGIFRLLMALHWQAGKLPDPRCANLPAYEIYSSKLELALRAWPHCIDGGPAGRERLGRTETGT